MTSQMTRGNLVAGTITNLNTPDQKVHFMFNPFEYTISKTNQYDKGPLVNMDSPKMEFKQGGVKTLQMNLFFDTLAERTSVTEHTEKLWQLMMVDVSKKNDQGKSAPPQVEFAWGRVAFKAFITTMSHKYTLFLEDGTPVRCTVQVSMEQGVRPEDVPPQDGQTSASGGNTTTTTAGDRPDNTANQMGSDQRTVAGNNNIDDPLNTPPGTVLR
jgi:hypothetical protein